MQKAKTKPPYKLFGVLFLLMMVIVIVNNVRKSDTLVLDVSDNAGVSLLETVNDSLVCVFHDGQTVVWDWNTLPQQRAGFSVKTNRVVLLDANRLVAVNETEKKVLSVYSLPSSEKIKDISVGWDDQEVWPEMSFNRSAVALIRKNPVDSAGKVLYEFLTIDIEKSLTGIPVSLSVQADNSDFIDFAVDENNVLCAVGSKQKSGRIAAVDLEKGNNLWDRTYEDTQEFCNIIVSPDNHYLLAGNRDGILYKLSAETGEVVKKIQLLEEGETRPITNDYSVLNLAFSPDGHYFVATIHPKAYLLKADSDEIVHICTPANRLISKIAFSPNNQFFATSDIRASYPIRIWPMLQAK
jgi:WD40 repeat protein